MVSHGHYGPTALPSLPQLVIFLLQLLTGPLQLLADFHHLPCLPVQCLCISCLLSSGAVIDTAVYDLSATTALTMSKQSTSIHKSRKVARMASIWQACIAELTVLFAGT